MLNKFLKEIVTIIVGKHAEDIVDLLIKEKYVNEFLIAKKMDLTINQTRNILYRISDHGLVSSIRKKDKKKGWYTYSWKIEIIKSLEFLKAFLNKRIGQINAQIKSRETKQFYVCERCKIEVSDESALLYDFTCNECGDIFVIKDNEKFLRELRRNLTKLNNELKAVEEEIGKHQEKLDKKRERELKKLEKEKAAKRKKSKKTSLKKTKIERKSAKKKVAKKQTKKKKIVKKKIAKKVSNKQKSKK